MKNKHTTHKIFKDLHYIITHQKPMRHIVFKEDEYNVLSQEGLMRWEKDHGRWCGSITFDNIIHYCKVIINDHRINKNLKTRKEKEDEWKEYSRTSIYSFPQRIINELKIPTTEKVNDTIYGRGKLSDNEISMILDTKNTWTLRELKDHENHIKSSLPESKAIACKETPIVLRLGGNDDTSYSKSFVTEKELINMVRLLYGNDNPWDIINKEFSFTN